MLTWQGLFTCNTGVLVVERLFDHQFFRRSDGVEHQGFPVVSPVGPYAEADLSRVCVLVERICSVQFSPIQFNSRKHSAR